VVAEEGFHAASVDLIAERAGLSIGALYSNFSGKDDLLLAVFDSHVQWFEEQANAAIQDPDLARATTTWLALSGESADQFLIFIEFWAYAVRQPKLRTQFAKRMAQMRAEVAKAVERAAAGRGITPQLPSELVALLALAIGRGVALEKLVDRKSVPDETVGQLLAGLLGS